MDSGQPLRGFRNDEVISISPEYLSQITIVVVPPEEIDIGPIRLAFWTPKFFPVITRAQNVHYYRSWKPARFPQRRELLSVLVSS
jgi:hypothetical protein